MKVRIGISNTDKLVELDVDDSQAFKKEIERAVQDGGMGWITDTQGRSIGIQAKHVAFIEMDDSEEHPQVGFAPAV